jgi:hypothetical protein
MECGVGAIAKQRHAELVSMTMDTHATMENYWRINMQQQKTVGHGVFDMVCVKAQ